MTTYLLRDVDDKTWQAFKGRCQDEGHSLRWVLMQLIWLYIREGL